MVTLLKRWNEFSPGMRVAVTRGQADILFSRGVAAIDPKGGRKAKRGNYAKRLSNSK